MGQIVASIKIFPEDIIIGADELKAALTKAIPEGDYSLYRIDEEPIAFGLVALVAHVVMSDTGEALNKVEDAFSHVKGVSQIETLMVRRL